MLARVAVAASARCVAVRAAVPCARLASSAPRPSLMIPGPIEVDPAVLAASSQHAWSHVQPQLVEAFGASLRMLRTAFGADDSATSFILPGSGTLAMESVAFNLIERGDRALVVNTGYFGDRMGLIAERAGGSVTHLRARIGDRPSSADLRAALKTGKYKAVFVTHVDTSTGVLNDIPAIAEVLRATQPDALLVCDGVCAAAGDEMRMGLWGVDCFLTASQKAIGLPPGLALFVASSRALDAFNSRTTPVASFYSDWAQWLPVMRAYEARAPAYFATPPTGLVMGLRLSLERMLADGMTVRYNQHREASAAVKAVAAELGLRMVPVSREAAANTMSAFYFPEGVEGPAFLTKMLQSGVIVAGGLHPEIRTKYFRIGHMGASAADPAQTDVKRVIGALRTALARK